MTTPARAHETILLVEDAAALREIVCEMLEGQGYDVLPCARGDEALTRARTHEGPIRLLLTDVTLPGISGGELARLLSAERPGLRVIYMSGDSGRAEAIAAGAELLEKPFRADDLVRVVRAALDA